MSCAPDKETSYVCAHLAGFSCFHCCSGLRTRSTSRNVSVGPLSTLGVLSQQEPRQGFVEVSTTEGTETHPYAARKGLRRMGVTHFSRKSPHSRNQHMGGGRMPASCPKVSFVLHSVPRERGLPCVQWLKAASPPRPRAQKRRNAPPLRPAVRLWYNTR